MLTVLAINATLAAVVVVALVVHMVRAIRAGEPSRSARIIELGVRRATDARDSVRRAA